MPDVAPATSDSPIGEVTKDERRIAFFLHLSCMLSIPPIVAYFFLKKRGGYVRHEAAEAANFSLTWLLYAFETAVLQAVFEMMNITPLVYVVGFVWLLLSFGYVIETIRAMVRATRGEESEHPITHRFFATD